MEERKGAVTLRGNSFTLVGKEVKVGDKAPDVELLDNDLKPVTFSAFKGKVVIVSSVPSLDTPTCDMETRRFNTEAAGLGDNVVILTVSTDLPFAQKRWCGAAGVDRVLTLSDHMNTDFGVKYGALVKERRTLRRSVFVVNKDDKLVYVAYMPEGGMEPDYVEVLDAARKARSE
jgi:thiol peroxidase